MADDPEQNTIAVHQQFKDAGTGMLSADLMKNILRTVPLLSDAEVNALRIEEAKLWTARCENEERYFAARDGQQTISQAELDAMEMAWIDAMAAYTTTNTRLFYAEARRYGDRWAARIKEVDPRLGGPARGQA